MTPSAPSQCPADAPPGVCFTLRSEGRDPCGYLVLFPEAWA